MFDSEARYVGPVFGCWEYRRLPDGGLAVSAPATCPRGHQLGPRRCTLNWNPGLRRMMVCCNTCYDADPATAMFLPAEPEWRVRFRELVQAHRTTEAMTLMNKMLPARPINRRPAGS